LASSIGFSSPTSGNVSNFSVVAIFAGVCLLQQAARSIFTIVILSGASGLIGLVAGASLLKCAALALAAFALLSLIEHFQNKKPDQPDNTRGKNAPPQTPPKSEGTNPTKLVAKKGPSKHPSAKTWSPANHPLVPPKMFSTPAEAANDETAEPPPPPTFSVPASEEEGFKKALKDFKAGETTPIAKPIDESSNPADPPQIPPIVEFNGVLVPETDKTSFHQLVATLTGLGEEEEYVETEDAGSAVPAVVIASSPKKSTLEHLYAEFLSTEKTFEEEMTSYSVKLELMKQTKLLTDDEYITTTKGLDILLETSAELIKSFQEQGPFATYSNDALIDKYYEALTLLTINASSASAILRKAIEESSCKGTYGDLWDKAVLPVQRGPRHPLLVASAIKEDTSFIPLQQKLEGKAQKINNSILLGQYNSLAYAIAQIARSKDLKFESWDNLGYISYMVIPRKNKGQLSGAAGIENDKSVPVIEDTLDFLIRIAKALNDPKLNIGLETINREQIKALFSTLQKHAWYTKAEKGKKKGRLTTIPNGILEKSQELKTILWIR